jgi:hypothetical protein
MSEAETFIDDFIMFLNFMTYYMTIVLTTTADWRVTYNRGCLE